MDKWNFTPFKVAILVLDGFIIGLATARWASFPDHPGGMPGSIVSSLLIGIIVLSSCRRKVTGTPTS